MTPVTCHRQRGVALIITLILLGVVTFMAITFLALSRRERSAVATVTDTAGARYAADAALANAEAQVIANVLSTNNPYSFGLLVSTNYVNTNGFVSGSSSYTNVNYFNYVSPAWKFISGNDLLQCLTNLYYSPRPPVFVPTNSAGTNDFRFYLDLNRNGQFEDTRSDVPNVEVSAGLAVTNGTISEVGDPQWIGILERPDAPHGPNNKFVARYAFIALPIGNTLDLNYIHNDATRPDPAMDSGHDGFLRNQGVGSWEINLAAFLTDLNTNQWEPVANLYTYDTWNGTLYNSGAGFDDALALLKYRYGDTYNNLLTANQMNGSAVGAPGDIAFRNDQIDGYSDRPLQTTFNTNADWVADVPTLPWAGADNTNHFFTHQELFNSNEISPTFVNRLLAAGQTNSSYDRYTFYRLLSQLGTDSSPESGKMNLNYVNVNTNGTVVPGMETNFYCWTNSLQFFTNAADRLLRAYTIRWRDSNLTNFAAEFYGVTNFNSVTNVDQWTNYPAFGIGNIPVWVSNRFVYSTAVNRLLQLAANICDATTNNASVMGRDYPSVFRPLFSMNLLNYSTNIYITGYTNVLSVTGVADERLGLPMEIGDLAATNVMVTNLVVNVYGVPWIIGAKKGFPSFNRFTFESVVGITRRLQVTRPSPNGGAPIDFSQFKTNQMYTMSVSNYLGAEFWNSYASGYTGAVQIVTRDYLSTWLTNDFNGVVPTMPGYTNFLPVFGTWINSANAVWGWAGWAYNGATIAYPAANSFVVPLITNAVSLPESIFRFTQLPPYVPTDTNSLLHAYYESNLLSSVGSQFPFPHFVLLTTNRIQAFVLENLNGAFRIIDYVQFQQTGSRDINAEFFTDTDTRGVWIAATNAATGISEAILNQLRISRGLQTDYTLPPFEDGLWKADPLAIQQSHSVKIPNQQAYFDAFFKPNNRTTDPVSTTNTSLSVQAPYSPTRYVVQCTFMQANDPLVHYLASDLNQFSKNKRSDYPDVAPAYLTNLSGLFLNGLDFRQLTRYFQPWGGNPAWGDTGDTNQFNLSIKDPQMYTSDNWDFPTNKFPGIGWVGRVHRGTPWQTVFLKGTNVLKTAPALMVTYDATKTPIETNVYYGGTNVWAQWTGDKQATFSDYYDAANSAPIQDRLLFDLFTTAFNDNATRGTLSVNVGGTNGPSLAAWSALFSGAIVLSNNASDATLIATHLAPPFPPSPYTPMVVAPAGAEGFNSLLGQLAAGISRTRANTNQFPHQAFEHVGDILSVPQLTVQSPFLNWNDPVQQLYGINDEMYEWLPQQTMGLLRCSSSPRYVIYCYGQTLKPAPNGIYTGSGQFFGLVTNYQVVSEIATRAVVRFGSMQTNVIAYTNEIVGGVPQNWSWFSLPVVTNNNAVIENFNILPPD